MTGTSFSAIGTVAEIAKLFGVSSPSTTCRTVMTRKAMAEAIPMPMIREDSPMTGPRSSCTALSPTAPRPSEAIVMPSWQAAR